VLLVYELMRCCVNRLGGGLRLKVVVMEVEGGGCGGLWWLLEVEDEVS
jgi:hypothetical protein